MMLVESSKDAIISHDLQGIISSWNRGAEQLYGYSASEAIGQPVSNLLGEDPSVLWECYVLLTQGVKTWFIRKFEA